MNSSLQENIITLLAFNEEYCSIIINTIDPNLFSNQYYRTIANKSIEFYNRFNTPPKEHLPDLLEQELEDKSKGDIYLKILESILENKDSINTDYVISELEKFVKEQNIKLAIKEATEAVQRGDIEFAESVLEKSRSKRIISFDIGTEFIKDEKKTFEFLDKRENLFILSGIKELDKLEVCPAPKQLFTLVGRSGSGKSWFLVHLAKMAMKQRKKILHISLEMSEDELKGRYFQSLFGLGMRHDGLQREIPLFHNDKFGNLTRIDYQDIDTKRIRTMKDNDIREYISNEIKNRLYSSPHLIIKEFPTGSLSVKGLNAYLDNLEGYYNFIPDMILLDYIDLMDIDVDKLRIDLGATGVALRGIAVERNLAMVTVKQTNRAGEGQAILTRKHLAEDFSAVRISDYLVTYNQTPQEYKKRLARLYVDKARGTRAGDMVIIAQNYSLGQFCLSSARFSNEYYTLIGEEKK